MHLPEEDLGREEVSRMKVVLLFQRKEGIRLRTRHHVLICCLAAVLSMFTVLIMSKAAAAHCVGLVCGCVGGLAHTHL